MKRTVIVLSLAILVLWNGCIFESSPKTAGRGGSSETTNGLVMGFVQKSDASSAQNIRVVLRTRNFLKSSPNPVSQESFSSGETVTDAQGKFYFKSVEPGDYFIEANDRGKLGVIQDFSTGDRDTITLGALLLKPTGAVIGSIQQPSASLLNAQVQIYGMDRLAYVDKATGQFSFPDMPEGAFTLRASVLDNTYKALDISGVNALAADTTDIGTQTLSSFEDEDYRQWPKSLRIQLNTTSSGAGVSRNVQNFPLLIRLNKGNFDFSLAEEKSIRFSDQNGKHLPYQVERWNISAQLAEIWVRTNIVHGNSHSDYITMHYGKNGSQGWSNGRLVFESENGFGGVWHLNEEAADSTRKGLYHDATPSAQNGDDRILSTEVGGIIGLGHGFSPGDYIKAQPSLKMRPKNEIYLSAWFRGKSTSLIGSAIVSLGDAYGLRVEPSGTVKFFIAAGKEAWDKVVPMDVNVLDSAWHFIVGCFDGKFLRVFVDGEEVGKVASSQQIPYILGPDFYIGRHGTAKREFDLLGNLDEVQVHNVARGAAWIKLCFESQRQNSTLLEFPLLN